jgi:hypothetical protein
MYAALLGVIFTLLEFDVLVDRCQELLLVMKLFRYLNLHLSLVELLCWTCSNKRSRGPLVMILCHH